MASTTARSASGSLRYATYIGVFLIVCLLNFLVSNLPTFLDLGVVTLATIGGVVFGRKTVDWY